MKEQKTNPQVEEEIVLFDKKSAIEQAQDLLTRFKDEGKTIDSANWEIMVNLAEKFRKNSTFTYARRLYQVLHQKDDDDKKVIERLAVCTYKDDDLSSDIKYNTAEKLLLDNFGEGPNDEITNAKILGILGSIYKKKWKYENHDGHLYRSLRYYDKGYKIALQNDDFSNIGFCGINLAFVYNQLANLESHRPDKRNSGLAAGDEVESFKDTAEIYTSRAREIRKKIRKAYQEKYPELKKEWARDPEAKKFFDEEVRFWFFVTWAEALMGIGESNEAEKDESFECFSEATEKFREAIYSETPSKKPPYWMRHSASIQGFQLVELLYRDKPEQKIKAQNGLKALLDVDSVPDNHTNKIGLALSGGGFRASLFHIGVLAKLAEADLLRKVEVISCVSGGSILGAYYYLKLKEMLEREPPKDENGNHRALEKRDYINLVSELEKEFRAGVNKNVRINILSNAMSNVKMMLDKTYTRSERTAELYDKFFYNKFIDKEKGRGGRKYTKNETIPDNEEYDKTKRDFSKIYMHDLRITPWGKKSFRPDRDNWKEQNKVPVLILNATTLNTGHSWQFTASWMGESPAYINSEFDALPTLRRMYYDEAPPKYRERVALSTAVVASAGVPGIFAPVVFDDLYDDDVKLLLVDGGVHDNQGLSTLYEQECNQIIVSDASGQLVENPKPAGNALSVILRTNSIFQERIRFSQFRDLEARKNSGVIRDYMLMHFTKDLPGNVISWKKCKDPYISPDTDSLNRSDTDSTDYNIFIGVQKLLSRVRTDLDAFHETEAGALMYSGYSMTAREIEISPSDLFTMPEKDKGRDFSDKWHFLKVQKVHDSKDACKEMVRLLEPSSKLFWKSLMLSSFGRRVGGWWKTLLLILLLCVVGYNFSAAIDWFKGADCARLLERLQQLPNKRNLIILLVLLLVIPGFALLMSLTNKVSNYFYDKEGRLPKVDQ